MENLTWDKFQWSYCMCHTGWDLLKKNIKEQKSVEYSQISGVVKQVNLLCEIILDKLYEDYYLLSPHDPFLPFWRFLKYNIMLSSWSLVSRLMRVTVWIMPNSHIFWSVSVLQPSNWLYLLIRSVKTLEIFSLCFCQLNKGYSELSNDRFFIFCIQKRSQFFGFGVV